MNDQPRTTRRRTLLGAAALGLAAAPLLGGTASAADQDRKGQDGQGANGQGQDGTGKGRGSFVTARGGELRLDGRAFRFGGTNCYYLHQQSHYMIDAVLNDAAAMGLTVIRAWAFADGDGHSYRALQPEPFSYDEAAFDSLDYAVQKAGQLGLRLVLPLVNNWPDYGGMQQYVSWFLGLP
ncbi:hypothetical protein ACFW6T_35675, partial [Kitasatospora phosalacinea]